MKTMISGAAGAAFVTLSGGTQPPELGADSATTIVNESVIISPLTNDTDPNDLALTITAATLENESHGSLVINLGTTITFTPATDFIGTAVINYTVQNEDELESESTITVSVTEPPDLVPNALNDTAETYENETVTIDVLANDLHEYDDLTIISAVIDSGGGSVSIVENQLQYTPAEDYTGLVEITYTIQDEDDDTDFAEVEITVLQSEPTAEDDTITTPINTLVSINVRSNDTHPVLGEVLTLISASVDESEGSVVLNSGNVDYTPATDYEGYATITYTIEDENGDQDSGTVSVAVGSVASSPYVNMFDEAVTPVFSRQLDGSTSGTAKTNCNLWSLKLGYDHDTETEESSEGTEWRTLANDGRGPVRLLMYEELTKDELQVRCVFKVDTYPAATKTYVKFDTLYMTPAWYLWIDISNDSTHASNRVLSHSGEVTDAWVEEHPTASGYIGVKFKLDLTGVADTDGAVMLNLSDQDDGGDGLYDTDNNFIIRFQDLTMEVI